MGVLRNRSGLVATVAVAVLGLPLLGPVLGPVAASAQIAQSIVDRHMGVSRERAADRPRSEGDQTVVNGWPLYRTERGQEAYNATMATLAATAGPAPGAPAFRRCFDLDCDFDVPRIGRDGWIPAGRIWISPSDYILIVHSPRNERMRRRSDRSMRYFVFHEFHNSSRNTDPYDTISSHRSRVFVPFYMSKAGVDAYGRKYVAIVQVAPFDVVSVHATNYGSSGPGVEVAKNMADDLEPLQARAGIVLARMVKRAVPHLRVVNHRGREGLSMLRGYDRWAEARQRERSRQSVALPFVDARGSRVASARAGLADLIFTPGRSRQLAVRDRAFVPPRSLVEEPQSPQTVAAVYDEPQLVGPIRLARPPAAVPETLTEPRPVRPRAPVLVRPAQLVRRSAFASDVGQ